MLQPTFSEFYNYNSEPNHFVATALILSFHV